MKFSKAFTIIELVFVIVILGILAGVALPKFTGIRIQADIANGRAQLSTIRTAIVNDRQTRLILGCNKYAELGIGTYTCPGSAIAYKDINNGDLLFGGVLSTPIANADSVNDVGDWYSADTALGVYSYKVGDGATTNFTYEDVNGTITCTQAGTNHCDDLSN